MSFCFKGELSFPGDKSLSHRSVIIAALSKGRSHITNFLPGQDTLHTVGALESVGIKTEGKPDTGDFHIISNGDLAFNPSSHKIYVGNSGTAARLLMGLFSGIRGIEIEIDGDESLRKRPMERITSQLSKFGAKFSGKNRLPIRIHGNQLLPIHLKEELGSAQVKSACILAGISSQTEVFIHELKPSRDHTENMFSAVGANISIEKVKPGKAHTSEKRITLKPPYSFNAVPFQLWGDISSAAFFCVLACLTKGSKVKLKDVSFNPYRTGYLDILQKMGASLNFEEKESRYGEKGGDIDIEYSPLQNIRISPEQVPSIIDEFPILVVAALFSEGVFEIRGARELRYKESDRIDAVCANLKSLGYEYEEYEDGLSLVGRPNFSPVGVVEGFKDHRIIMAFEIANLISKSLARKDFDAPDRITLQDSTREKNWIQTSFPAFYQKLKVCLHPE